MTFLKGRSGQDIQPTCSCANLSEDLPPHVLSMAPKGAALASPSGTQGEGEALGRQFPQGKGMK